MTSIPSWRWEWSVEHVRYWTTAGSRGIMGAHNSGWELIGVRRRFGKLTGVVAAAFVLVAPIALPAVAATPAAAQGQSCTEYTPTDLAIDVPAASPGQTVTISGMAYPGDTVTIRIATISGPPLVLGTVLVGPSGSFSTQVTIPADFPPGTYNVTVTSPQCPVGGVLTLVVVPGGGGTGGHCGVNPRHLRRNGTYRWRAVGNFDPSEPITITLVSRTPPPESFVLYSGPYRRRVSVTIPWAADNGSYLVLVSGTDRDGNPLTSGCRVRIKGHHGGGGSSSIPPSSGSIPPSSGSIPPGSGSIPHTSGSIPPSSGSIPPGSGSIPSSSTTSSTTVVGEGGGSSTTTAATSSTSSTTIAGQAGGSSTSSSTSSTTVATPPGSGSSQPPGPGSGVLGEQITSTPTPKVGSASVLGETATRQGTSVKQSGLAFTGATIRPFLVAGIAAIAFGALLLLKRRRRS